MFDKYTRGQPLTRRGALQISQCLLYYTLLGLHNLLPLLSSSAKYLGVTMMFAYCGVGNNIKIRYIHMYIRVLL